jgi:hypothetical protein
MAVILHIMVELSLDVVFQVGSDVSEEHAASVFTAVVRKVMNRLQPLPTVLSDQIPCDLPIQCH